MCIVGHIFTSLAPQEVHGRSYIYEFGSQRVNTNDCH